MTFKQEGIYPGLPSMTTLPHSSKCPSLGDNVDDHLIYPSLYIKHYRNWRLPGYCLSYGFFSSHTLYLMPFSILPQHSTSVLCAIWSSWSPCVPFFPPVCSFQPPVLTEIWLFSEDSVSHLSLEVGGCGGVMVFSLLHIAALRPLSFLLPRNTHFWPNSCHPTISLSPPPHCYDGRDPSPQNTLTLFLEGFDLSLLFLNDPPDKILGNFKIHIDESS